MMMMKTKKKWRYERLPVTAEVRWVLLNWRWNISSMMESNGTGWGAHFVNRTHKYKKRKTLNSSLIWLDRCVMPFLLVIFRLAFFFAPYLEFYIFFFLTPFMQLYRSGSNVWMIQADWTGTAGVEPLRGYILSRVRKCLIGCLFSVDIGYPLRSSSLIIIYFHYHYHIYRRKRGRGWDFLTIR